MGMPVEPVWAQEDYAFYSDGTESGAVIVGSAGAQQTLSVDTVYHCRLLIADTAPGTTNADVPNLTLLWQYNLASGGWNTITGSSPVQFVDNANLTDGGATTNRDPTGTGGFSAGRIYETANTSAVVISSSGSTQHTEVVLHFQIDSAQVTNGQEILVRCTEGDTTVFNSYVNADIDVSEAVSDTLLADDVSSLTNVSIPSVGQKHALLANNAESLSSVSIPSVGQEHALLANDAESASAVSQPAIAIVSILLADDVESASAVSSNVLGQVHALTQGGAESASAVSVPSVGQEHSLLADNAESASAVSVPSLGQEHILLADNAESSTALSLPSLSESSILLANDVESTSSVSVPAIGQEHGLLANNAESSSEVSVPSVGQEHALLANNAESSTELTSPSIGQEHGLLANNAESASQVSAPNLVDVPAGGDALLADDVESLTEVSAPSIGQEHVLLANDVESTSEVSAPNLVDVSVVTASDRGGSSGGGTGRKYKKALREGKGKVRIGRLEDVSLPNPRILIDELTEEIVEEVTKDIKREKPGITLRQLADVIAETKRVLKEKKRLDELKRLIKIAYLKSISDRRKKKALLEAENLIKEEIYKVLEIKAEKERERIEAEKERIKTEKERKIKAERQARDSKDLEVILYILAKVA